MDFNAFSNAAASAVLEDDRLPELLADLGWDVKDLSGGNVLRGPCPVHGGDGHNFQIDTDGDVLPIRWKCWSNQCEERFKPSLLGLVRGVLSFQACKDVPVWEAVNYLKAFLGNRSLAQNTRPAPKPPKPMPSFPRLTSEQVRSRLIIPSPYFVARGFSPTVLDRMDVGYSNVLSRHVVPVYDESGRVCIGYTARSPYERCLKCGCYHDLAQACPEMESRRKYPKWKNPEGWKKADHLYGFGEALRSSQSTVLLVEGPGDVWRCTEAGIVGVACLGHDLSFTQSQMLARLHKRVMIAFDADEPGRKGAKRAFQRFRDHSVLGYPTFIPPPYADIGEMPAAVLQGWFRGQAVA